MGSRKSAFRFKMPKFSVTAAVLIVVIVILGLYVLFKMLFRSSYAETTSQTKTVKLNNTDYQTGDFYAVSLNDVNGNYLGTIEIPIKAGIFEYNLQITGYKDGLISYTLDNGVTTLSVDATYGGTIADLADGFHVTNTNNGPQTGCISQTVADQRATTIKTIADSTCKMAGFSQGTDGDGTTCTDTNNQTGKSFTCKNVKVIITIPDDADIEIGSDPAIIPDNANIHTDSGEVTIFDKSNLPLLDITTYVTLNNKATGDTLGGTTPSIPVVIQSLNSRGKYLKNTGTGTNILVSDPRNNKFSIFPNVKGRTGGPYNIVSNAKLNNISIGGSGNEVYTLSTSNATNNWPMLSGYSIYSWMITAYSTQTRQGFILSTSGKYLIADANGVASVTTTAPSPTSPDTSYLWRFT